MRIGPIIRTHLWLLIALACFFITSRVASAGLSATWTTPRSSALATLIYSGLSYNLTYGTFCTPDGQVTIVVKTWNGDDPTGAIAQIYPQAHAKLTNGSGGRYDLAQGNAQIQPGCYRVDYVLDSDYVAGNNVSVTVWYNGKSAAQPTPNPYTNGVSQTGDTINGTLPNQGQPTPSPTKTPAPTPQPTPRTMPTCPPGTYQESTAGSTSPGQISITCVARKTPQPTSRPTPAIVQANAGHQSGTSSISSAHAGQRAATVFAQQNQHIADVATSISDLIIPKEYAPQVSATYRIPPPDFSDPQFSCAGGSVDPAIVQDLRDLTHSYNRYRDMVDDDVRSYNAVAQATDIKATIDDAYQTYMVSSIADDVGMYQDDLNSTVTRIAYECQKMRIAQANAVQDALMQRTAPNVIGLVPVDSGLGFRIGIPQGWSRRDNDPYVVWALVRSDGSWNDEIMVFSKPFDGALSGYARQYYYTERKRPDARFSPIKVATVCGNRPARFFSDVFTNGAVFDIMLTVWSGRAYEIRYIHSLNSASTTALRALNTMCVE